MTDETKKELQQFASYLNDIFSTYEYSDIYLNEYINSKNKKTKDKKKSAFSQLNYFNDCGGRISCRRK